MKLPRATFPVVLSLLVILGGVACFDHFHDGPPPDLSRFHRPEHDPVAYAEVKRLTDKFASEFKEYKPVEAGDPDDDAAEDDEHTLNYLALHGDANGLRALKRHLKENEAALATARELVALKKVSFEPIPVGNAFSTSNVTQLAAKQALNLLYRGCIQSGIDKQTAVQWKVTEDMFVFAKHEHTSSRMRVDSLMAAGSENIAIATVQSLSGYESNARKIRDFLTTTAASRIDPMRFTAAFSGEIIGLADFILPGRGGKISLLNSAGGPSFSAADWLKKPATVAREWWLGVNILPNDMVSRYASSIDEERANQTPFSSAEPARPNWGFWLLSKNAGGMVIMEPLISSHSLFRTKFFKTTAQYDLTRLVLALRVYQLEHAGKFPATLTELSPGILPNRPDDVFAPGHAYHYDAKAGKVWSVGPDGVDGGGDEVSDVVVKLPPASATN